MPETAWTTVPTTSPSSATWPSISSQGALQRLLARQDQAGRMEGRVPRQSPRPNLKCDCPATPCDRCTCAYFRNPGYAVDFGRPGRTARRLLPYRRDFDEAAFLA